MDPILLMLVLSLLALILVCIAIWQADRAVTEIEIRYLFDKAQVFIIRRNKRYEFFGEFTNNIRAQHMAEALGKTYRVPVTRNMEELHG